ncbi:UNVERIFIED_CONTAM: hypothetical protein RMT77_010913 [Armadillidium vulgare]
MHTETIRHSVILEPAEFVSRKATMKINIVPLLSFLAITAVTTSQFVVGRFGVARPVVVNPILTNPIVTSPFLGFNRFNRFGFNRFNRFNRFPINRPLIGVTFV